MHVGFASFVANPMQVPRHHLLLLYVQGVTVWEYDARSRSQPAREVPSGQFQASTFEHSHVLTPVFSQQTKR
jgi:hypothetical protein